MRAPPTPRSRIEFVREDAHGNREIISHYHRDHYGCTAAVLTKFPLQQFAYDRGGSYHAPAAFTSYVTAVGAKRRTATDGQVITLNASGTPVTIQILALNGNGVDTTNENDESVVSRVSFGNFRAELGGDLSDFPTTAMRTSRRQWRRWSARWTSTESTTTAVGTAPTPRGCRRSCRALASSPLEGFLESGYRGD
jgi:beta-lactamase superfamily II metal-dependent hydrolase